MRLTSPRWVAKKKYLAVNEDIEVTAVRIHGFSDIPHQLKLVRLKGQLAGLTRLAAENGGSVEYRGGD